MQKVLPKLIELQHLDMQLNEVRTRLATFPKKLAEVEARVTAAKAEVAQNKAAQLTAVKERSKYELDVQQHTDRVRKYRDQTSQVKTNEAYKALQHEVQMAEDEIAKAEDRLLEQMVAGEEYDRRIKAAEKLLKEVEEVARVQRKIIEDDKGVSEKRLVELTAERTAILADIPENLLDHYDRISKKHNGIALAEVRDEKCSACGMRLRPHVHQEMQRGDSDELFHCETCTRIIYLSEPARSVASASTAPQDDHPSQ
ncbi:MAG: zinc ribbon domain-containing protein [Chthoniobacterales bacterium]